MEIQNLQIVKHEQKQVSCFFYSIEFLSHIKLIADILALFNSLFIASIASCFIFATSISEITLSDVSLGAFLEWASTTLDGYKSAHIFFDTSQSVSHNRVSKPSQTENGREFFVRFTVQRSEEGTTTSHGVRVVDVGLIENPFRSSRSFLAVSKAITANEKEFDAKLENFIEVAKTGKQKFSESEYLFHTIAFLSHVKHTLIHMFDTQLLMGGFVSKKLDHFWRNRQNPFIFSILSAAAIVVWRFVVLVNHEEYADVTTAAYYGLDSFFVNNSIGHGEAVRDKRYGLFLT